MKGFIKQTAATLWFSAALFTLLGCYHYRDVVDPCYPERYNSMARHSVREMHNAQADKGHLLDHTIWSNDFDGKKLKPSGIERLRYVSHREPAPLLMKVYLQTVTIPFDPKRPAEDQIKERDTLNEARIESIKAFLATQTSEDRNTTYEIKVHEYAQPTYPAEWSVEALEVSRKNIRDAKLQTFIIPASQGGATK